MRFSIGPIELSISRRRKNRGESSLSQRLSKDGIDTLNAGTLRSVRMLSHCELLARVEAVTVDASEVQAGSLVAAACLEREGIVVIRDVLQSDAVEEASRAAARVKKALSALESDYFENEHLVIQGAKPRYQGYSALANATKTVANVRQGADQGMIDVFNVDHLMAKPGKVRKPFEDPWVVGLVGCGKDNLKAANLNLYLNRDVTKTRGFHADTYSPMLKGFVYLTDVVCLDDGPYAYVRGSHRPGPWRTANQKISEAYANDTEAPFVDPSRVVPVLAEKGSLVISDQAGFHRGIPQALGHERQVLVMAYRPT